MKSSNTNTNGELHGEMPVPVILGAWMNAYGLVRSLGEKGLHSILAAAQAGPAVFSRYIRTWWRLPTPGPTPEAIRTLLGLADGQSSRMVLIPTDEAWVVAILDRRDEFERRFALPLPGTETARLVLTKTQMHRWCQGHGIQVPRTSVFRPGDDWEEYLRDFEDHLPVIVKPETKGVGDAQLGFMTRVFTSMKEVAQWGSGLGKEGPSCGVLRQQLLLGQPTNIAAFHGYRTADGRTFMAGITKMRLQPPVCGSSTMTARFGVDPEAEAATLDVLEKLNYHGFFDAEFMRDDASGQLFFIEINPRPGMPNYAATAMGVNVPYIACADQIGAAPPVSQVVSAGDGIWTQLVNDLICYVIFYRSSGHGLGLRTWWRSMRGKQIVDVYFSAKDWRVFLVSLAFILQQSIGHLPRLVSTVLGRKGLRRRIPMLCVRR